MIKTHNIAVDNYSITPETIDVGTKGSYGNEQLRFSFSKEWQGLLVKVSFRPPNLKPVVLLLSDGGVVDIPEEVTRNGGKTQYIVSGHADGRLIKSLIGELNVLNTLNVATTPPDSPTPTEMEQVEQWLLEAIALAQSVRDDADNGVFDGEDGETPVFSVGEVEKGEEPELTITGTILNPVLNFTLPKGDKGNTGATGDTGATFTPNVSESGIISWDNDKELPNPPERDITGPIGPAGVVIGVPPANDPLKRVWVDPDGEALINEVIDNLIEESTIARDESVEAKGITLEAKDETLEARDETVTARDDAEAFAEQTALDRTATGADRTATGEDRAAVNTALSGFATDTLPDAVQAIENKADAEITRVGQAGDAQVQAVEQVGGEQIQAATEQADRAEREADDALDAKDAAETAQGKAEDAQGLAEGAKVDAITAQGKAEDAQGSAEDAAVLAESHSKGGTASREGEDTDNALYYKGLAESAKTAAETAQGLAEDAQLAAERAAGTAATETVEAASLLLSGYVTDAQTAKADAETAQGKAEDAQAAAEEAQEGAETASDVAVAAHNTSPTAHADNFAAKADKLTEGNYTPGNVIMSDESGNIADSGYSARVLDGTYKRYGVSGVGGSATTLTRLWDAVGQTAAVGTDTQVATNSFDHLAPFNRRKCVGHWIGDGDKAKFIVQSYDGDPDFAEDGTMGDYVAVEIVPSWYYQDDFSQFNPKQITGTLGASPTPVPGWKLHPLCRNADGSIRQKTYLPCYPLALKDGKPVSLPGLTNSYGSYKSLFDIARTYNDPGAAQCATLEPMMVRHYEWLMFTIEFATTNCQSIMQGATSMPYTTNAITAISADIGVVTAAIGNGFVIGQRAYIGTTYSEAHMGTHTILDIEQCDEDGTLNPSGAFRLITLDPISTVTDITTITNPTISSRPYPTGACNSVLTPSGSPVSNTSAKHPMRYRYRENIWGNQYSTCHDLIAKRIGDGTTENPYLVEWYYLIDPTYYPTSTSKPDDADLSTGAWVKLEQTSVYQNGYIRQIAMDSRYPHVITPVVSSDASSVTFYCDYVYHENTPIIRAVWLGGHVSYGAYFGVLFFYACLAPSYVHWSCGGGLYFLQ